MTQLATLSPTTEWSSAPIYQTPIHQRADEPDREPRLDALVRDHGQAVLHQTVRLTAGDRAWAEDVVQETMIRAWRRLDRMTEEHGSVRSWLLRVAHNLVVDGYRAKRSTEVELDAEQTVDKTAPDDTDQVLNALVVEEALATLPVSQRAVLEEIYLHDRSVIDASRVLDLPVGTVKSRAFYALRRLRTAQPVSSHHQADTWPR